MARLVALLIAALLASQAIAVLADSGTVDVEVPDKTKSKSGSTSDGALVTYVGDSDVSFGPAGTGVFEPFVRVQNSPTQRGYNTDGPLEFDTKAGVWTHSLRVSDVPVVIINGVAYWEFLVDINETNNTPRVSLTDVELWITSNPSITGYPFAGATRVYDFQGNIKINDVNQGSGRADLLYRIPVSAIVGGIPAGCSYLSTTCSTYLVLYNAWGIAGDYESDGGFEEWRVNRSPAVTIIKQATGGDATFTFSLAPGGTSVQLTTVNGTARTTFALEAGTYTLTEATLSGWTLESISCSVNGGAATSGTFTIRAGNTPDQVVCTVTNRKDVQTGSLSISKVFTPGASGFTGTFTINLDCPGTANDATLNLAAGGNQTITNLPTGVVCTVSETLPSNPSGWTFGTPTFTESSGTPNDGSVTIGNNTTVTVAVNNSITQVTGQTGSLTVSKVFTPGASGFTGNFTINVDCPGTANDATLNLAAGGNQTITNIPTGVVCTVSETLPTNPSGWTFGTPTFTETSGTPNDGSVTIGNTTVTVAVNNSITQVTGGAVTPSVSLVKRNSLSGTTAAGSISASTGTVGWQWLIDVNVTGAAATATLSDTIPAGLTIGTVTDNHATITCSVALQVVTCNLAATPVGTHLVTIPVTAPAGTQAANCLARTNQATVSGTNISAQSNSNTVNVTGCGGGGVSSVGGGDVGNGGSSPPPSVSQPTPTAPAGPPPAQVLGSNAQILKVRTSADPARVGERVTFTVTLSITGDAPVTGVALTDTFENRYLRYVSSTPAGCTVTVNAPDAAHNQISCPIGDVTPGTAGSPGTRSFVYTFTFDAIAPTPARTINSVVARADLDGAGPAGPTTIGPSTADVQIIAPPVSLPKAGDGSLAPAGATGLNPWWMLAVLAAGLAVAGWSRLLDGRAADLEARVTSYEVLTRG